MTEKSRYTSDYVDGTPYGWLTNRPTPVYERILKVQDKYDRMWHLLVRVYRSSDFPIKESDLPWSSEVIAQLVDNVDQHEGVKAVATFGSGDTPSNAVNIVGEIMSMIDLDPSIHKKLIEEGNDYWQELRHGDPPLTRA